MGLIRKTVSITTLGIVDFRSKKEQIRRAEKAQRQAQAALAGVEAARRVTDLRLAEAEKRARRAEVLALQQAELASEGKAKRRDRRRAAKAMDAMEDLVTNVGPAIEEQAKELSRRGRKVAKKARKQADQAAAKARKQASRHRRRAKEGFDDLMGGASGFIDERL